VGQQFHQYQQNELKHVGLVQREIIIIDFEQTQTDTHNLPHSRRLQKLQNSFLTILIVCLIKSHFLVGFTTTYAISAYHH
jgi:hypothetical protein